MSGGKTGEAMRYTRYEMTVSCLFGTFFYLLNVYQNMTRMSSHIVLKVTLKSLENTRASAEKGSRLFLILKQFIKLKSQIFAFKI